MMRPTLPRRGERGNALMEFALAFSFLFPLFYGTFQFGYTFFLYNELHSAVRDGARYASYRTYDSASSTPSDAWTAAVKNAVVYGNPAGGSTPNVPNMTTGNVSVAVTFRDGIPDLVTVGITGYQINALFRTYTLSKPTMTISYTGRWAP